MCVHSIARRLARSASLLVLLLPAVASGGKGNDESVPKSSRIPMYGQPGVARPAGLKAIDEQYVQSMLAVCDNDRRAACVGAWALAEDYLAEDNLDQAMARYNESWLIDSRSYLPFWGFGRVLTRRHDAVGATVQLEEARRLGGDSLRNVAMLADLATAYSLAGSDGAARAANSARYIALADSQFAECLRIDPLYAAGWIAWARADHRAGRYAAAWKKVSQARSLSTNLPESFLSDLRRKMPEPK